MTDSPGPFDPVGLPRIMLNQARERADDMQAPEAREIIENIPGIGGVRLVARNELAAARFELDEAEAAGAGPDVIEGCRFNVEIGAEECRMFGGNPDEVPADHVSAWVHAAAPGVTIGWTPVPVDAARKAGDRWEADEEDLPDGYPLLPVGGDRRPGRQGHGQPAASSRIPRSAAGPTEGPVHAPHP